MHAGFCYIVGLLHFWHHCNKRGADIYKENKAFMGYLSTPLIKMEHLSVTCKGVNVWLNTF